MITAAAQTSGGVATLQTPRNKTEAGFHFTLPLKMLSRSASMFGTDITP
jgi:hypothetical protein